VRRLQSGRWQARYYLPDGNRRTAPQRFATKTDALRFLATVEVDLLRGTFRAPQQEPSQTVAAWAARYIAAQSGRLTPKTQALYESLLRSCIEPGLGAVPVSQLSKISVREWVASLTSRGLSPSRVRQALVVLSQVMAAAVEDGIIVTNPCTGVRPPRLTQTEPRILTPTQVAALSAAVKPPYGVLVDLLAYCGLRIGEAFALRRRCVDELGRRLLVEESLSETGGRHSFGPTKTHQKRSIALPDFLLAELVAHLSQRVQASPDALLFVGRTGKPLHYNAFRRWTWDPATKTAGLQGVTPHDLRATCATWVADRAGVLEAAKRLGHARTSVTTRHYARPVEGRDRDVANQLADLRPKPAEEAGRPVRARSGHGRRQAPADEDPVLPLTWDDASGTSDSDSRL
jgi:integrase